MNRAWRIERESVSDSGLNTDLETVDVDGMDRFTLFREGPYVLSKPLVFRALVDRDKFGDYPFVTNRWPIFSTRVVAAFGASAATFPVKVRFRDRRVDEESFVLCTASALVHGVDLDASVMRPNHFSAAAPAKVKTPVLRTDVEWPRLFRLHRYPHQLYINDEAREALLAVGARGIGCYQP